MIKATHELAELLKSQISFMYQHVYLTVTFLKHFQVLQPLQQRFLNVINQENFQQICQEEEVKQEITATLEALCGIAEATQIDNVAILFNFLMDFLNNCIGLMEVYKNTPETVNLIIEVFVEVAHKQICYLGEVNKPRGGSVSVCSRMWMLLSLLQNNAIIFMFCMEKNPVFTSLFCWYRKKWKCFMVVSGWGIPLFKSLHSQRLKAGHLDCSHRKNYVTIIHH